MSVIKREFDNLASVYENNRLSPWYQAHGAEILKHCPPLEAGDILDVGCGTGHFLRNYLKNNPGARGVGLDISSAMIDEAGKKAQVDEVDNVEFVNGDFEAIDPQEFAAYNFKVIVCSSAFHYFLDPQRAAEKLYGLLADGGVLYVLERDKSRSLLTRLWGFLHRIYIKDQVEFYDRHVLLQFFRHAGFRNASVIQSIRRYFWKGKLFTSVVLIRCQKN